MVAFYLASAEVGRTSTTSHDHFTIVMSHSGFNDSTTHIAPWPVISVAKGETVTIRIVNEDPVEAHGFAIAHYFDKGIILGPKEFYDLTFIASDEGTFHLFCNVFCTVHVFMQSGHLVVS